MDQSPCEQDEATAPRPRSQRLQAPEGFLTVLASLVSDGEPRVSIRTLVDRSGSRSFDLLIMVLAAPAVAPLPPGVSDVLSAAVGAPLIFITAQLAFGRRSLWIPSAMGKKTIASEPYLGAIRRIAPWLERLDRWLHHRQAWVFLPGVERFTGLLSLFLAIVLFLPVPFTDSWSALALVALGAARLRRDGAALLFACAATLVLGLALGLAIGALVKLL
jgi:hypothetical protein